MAATVHGFDSEGLVRGFQDVDETRDGNATFMLEVGNLIIECQIERPRTRPPKNGQRMRVLGTWMRDENSRIYVDVHAIYAAHGVASE